MTPTERVLAMNLGLLTPEDLKWLHDQKNKAMVLKGKLYIAKIQAEMETL